MMKRCGGSILLFLAAAFCLAGCSRIETPEDSMVQPVMAEMSGYTDMQTTETTETTLAVSDVLTLTTEMTTTTTMTTTENLDRPFIEENSSIDPEKPMVALTFDDGPGKYTDSILDTLEAYSAHATFFVIGSNVTESRYDVLRRAVSLNCEIGSHTYDHTDLVKLNETDLLNNVKAADQSVLDAIGRYPYWLRPPYGSFDDTVRSTIGKPLTYWSVDTKDWSTKDTNATIQAATTKVEDGDIVLMHDIYASTADAVKQIVPDLLNQGYQLVTVSELLYYRGVEIEDGMIVFSMHPAKYDYRLPPSETEPAGSEEASS